METIPATELPRLAREGWRIVDVRAPVEFREGSLPGSLNLPILNDEERARVGTTYKERGSEAAEELGHALVTGAVKEKRIFAWVEALRPTEQALITCFRGGLRSRYAQEWTASAGVRRPRLREGYKGARSELRAAVERARALLVVAGATGSGKTELLRELREERAVLDLEACAEHRGSAFGGDVGLQPAQATFENRIGWSLLTGERADAGPWLVEDESRLVGRVGVPEPLFARMQAAPLVVIDEKVATRAARIFEEYVGEALAEGRDPYPFFRAAIGRIQKRLGGARAQELLADLAAAERAPADPGPAFVWITKLLRWYYDPFYADMLERRGERVLFRGAKEDVAEWLREHRGS